MHLLSHSLAFSLSHTDSNFLILVPNSWKVESDWPSPGPAMLEGSLLKYILPVGNLFLWMQQSREDRIDSSQSKYGTVVSLTLKNVSSYKCVLNNSIEKNRSIRKGK